MLIRDRIYGNFKIKDDIILELLKSEPVKRLKHISQFGVPDKYHFVKGFSRYEHSIGVMLILKKLGASLEEQVAGLLHDVSHSAFSHVIDWVLDQGKTENFQDDRHFYFITKSQIAGILEKYGYEPKRISDLQSFKLLDREIPDICADRIDYSLRQFPKAILKNVTEGLLVFKGRIVFKDEKLAQSFAKNFLHLQITDWAGFEGSSRYRIFSNILKRAITLRLINIRDFSGDEESILTKIEKSKDDKIRNGLSLLGKKSLSGLVLSRKRVFKKFRYVDPQFLRNGKLWRLSQTDLMFAKDLKKAKKKNRQGIVVASDKFSTR